MDRGFLVGVIASVSITGAFRFLGWESSSFPIRRSLCLRANARPGEPNWYVPTGAQRPDYRLDVARVIKQTQLEYDLDVD